MVLTKSMKKVTRIILVFMVAVGILGLTACSETSQELRIDSPAPDFKLNDINGQSVSLSSFKGKSVLINFWATTCSPCVQEMPHLQAIYNDWSGRSDVVLLAIDTGEDKTTVKNFIDSNKYTFPVLLDSQFEVAGKYYVQYTPTSIFIGNDGKIKLNIVGAFKDKTAIEKQLASYIN